MYLSELGRRKSLKSEALAQSCTVSTGGEEPAVISDGELRGAYLLAPGGIKRMPVTDEEQLIISCGDGQKILLGPVFDPETEELETGEVQIKNGSACISLMPDGSISISGRVYINGSELSGA